MSTVLHRTDKESVQIADGWDMDFQLPQIERWLIEHADALRGEQDMLIDIGFNSMLGEPYEDSTIAIQEQRIPVSLLKLLADLNITLLLSIYPPFADEDDDEYDDL